MSSVDAVGMDVNVNTKAKAATSLTRWDLFALVLPLIAVSPLLYRQANFLWARQHLQFFPLAFFAAAWFIRAEGIPNPYLSKRRSNVALGLSILGIACCYGAIISYSPWLAHLALIVLVFAWCLGKFANLSNIRILGICGLLAVTLPPPNNRDQLLVQALQSLSTTVSSRLMDINQILHVQSGNVIDIQSKSLFVEEACSGVDSQYALMAVAGVLLLVGRAGLFVSLITIVTVPLWAILGNLLRIYSIVFGIEYFGIDLSSGTLHTALGLITFSLAAWAHWSSVQFLNYLSFTFPSSGVASRQTEAVTVNQVFTESPVKAHATALRKWMLILPSGLLLATPLLLASAFFSQSPSELLPKLNSDVMKLLPSKNDLMGSEIMTRQASFTTQDRSRGDLMGQHSRVWTFSMDDVEQIASLDLPYWRWHELWLCYQLTGWKDLSRKMVNVNTDGSPLDWPYFEVQLQHQDGTYAVLHFSNFMQNGEPIDYSQMETHGGYAGQYKRWLLPMILSQLRQMQATVPISFQFQLLSRTQEPASREQIAQFRALFFETRENVRKKSIPAFQMLMGNERSPNG